MLGEAVATAGLSLLVVGLDRVGRDRFAPFAVALYLVAAYWFISSRVFANPQGP